MTASLQSAFARRPRGFTLIELLTVVAVIGILASILIPVVGGARKTANKGKSKAQFSGYAQALIAFQTEYGYFPDIGSMGSSGNSTATDLGDGSNSTNFIKALSGRDPNSTNGARDTSHNPRAKAFYSFAESEFYLPPGSDTPSSTQLADAFNNRHIKILVDSDGSGKLDLTSTVASRSGLGTNTSYRGKVAIWTLKEDDDGAEDVFSWN